MSGEAQVFVVTQSGWMKTILKLFNPSILLHTHFFRGPLMVAQWLRHCATNRKVAGSIPDGVNGIFPLT
jgi:hypothetical protein